MISSSVRCLRSTKSRHPNRAQSGSIFLATASTTSVREMHWIGVWNGNSSEIGATAATLTSSVPPKLLRPITSPGRMMSEDIADASISASAQALVSMKSEPASVRAPAAEIWMKRLVPAASHASRSARMALSCTASTEPPSPLCSSPLALITTSRPSSRGCQLSAAVIRARSTSIQFSCGRMRRP